MSTSDRKAELERKKAKLEAMRAEKKRKEEIKRKQQEAAAAAGEGQGGPGQPDLRTEAEKMLKDLGIPDTGAGGRSVTPVGGAAPGAPGGSPPASFDGSDRPTITQHSVAKKVNLSVSKVTQTHIPPKETVSYSKETQTPHETHDREARPWDYYALTYVDLDDDNDSLDVAVDTPPPASVSSHHKPSTSDMKAAQTPDDVTSPKEEEKPAPVRELTEEEKYQIERSDDYVKFIDYTSRLMERALTEYDDDIFTDYTGEHADDNEGGLSEGERLKVNRVFYDERWSKHRTITCMDWSVQHPELLVASYNTNEDAPHEPDGVTLVWNLKFKKTAPEYIFHYQSAVMSTCFAKFHPNLVVGGTYSGQIVLWDNRSNKRTPVQRTPLSASAHTHPVYCVNVVGTQNAHNLISVSTDGKMCSWSLDMLSQPQDSMELQHKQSKAVAATSFSFLHGDVNNFVVGSEEGAVYTACRHGSKAGISDVFEGHHGPITGIDCHATPGAIDFSHYFVTSSFDWTVKLWNIKENKPLHSFEDNSDYVYDARWSPVHPALFATVDGMGRLDIWNLNNDTEVPTASTVIDGQVALNKCRWHQNGHQIAAGDDLGKLHIFDVGETLAIPKNDDWSKFVHTLADLKTEQTEQEDEANLNLLSSSPYR